ncbi:hypothetical protein Q7P37_002566 [Cladosporium fusiforme]
MPIKLLPMTEADVDAQADLMWAAFGTDLMDVFYPNGFSATDREHSKKDTLASMRKGTDETFLFIKAVDTDLNNQIVSTAKWQIYPRQRSQEELDSEAAGGREHLFSEGANVEAMKEFFGELAQGRKERFGGDPYVLLSILVVHPDHQRRGLGAMQLEKGLEVADRLGLPAYLESSPKGKGLYAKYGFEDKGDMVFDARKYGRAENVPHTFMLRPARVN